MTDHEPIDAARLRDECKDLAEIMAGRAAGVDPGEFVEPERRLLHDAIDRLAALAAPQVPQAPEPSAMLAEIGHEERAKLDAARAAMADKAPGSEWHLTMLMAPYHLNMVVGQDRQHLLAWARDVWRAAQPQPIAVPAAKLSEILAQGYVSGPGVAPVYTEAQVRAAASSVPAAAPEWVRDGIADHIECNWPHNEMWPPTIAERVRQIEIRPLIAAAAQPVAPASPRGLTEAQIERGWHATFSTGNPFCPCDLKSFTKAVRWAEHATQQPVQQPTRSQRLADAGFKRRPSGKDANGLIRESAEPPKDHEIAAAINMLRDIANNFYNTQQLRERIAGVVLGLVKPVQQGGA